MLCAWSRFEESVTKVKKSPEPLELKDERILKKNSSSFSEVDVKADFWNTFG